MTNRPDAMFEPVSAGFAAGQKAYHSALIGFINGARQAKGEKAVRWPKIATTPRQEIWKSGNARLYRFGSPKPGENRPAVMAVCSLINRAYILDLLPERSVIAKLIEQGLDVWLLDWGTPSPEESGAGLDRYVLDLLPSAFSVVARETRQPHPFILGYCMGGTFALVSTAAQAIAPGGIIALATPVGFEDPGLLSVWCRTPKFEPKELAQTFGNIPPFLLQPVFKMLDPVGIASKFMHLHKKLDDEKFLRFFLAMETWLEDSVAFPGGAFRDWVDLYRSNSLVRGTLKLRDRKVKLSNIRCPVLNIVAEADYITPLESSLALADHVTGPHTVVRLRGGHIGLSTGSEAHRSLWPAAAEWVLTQAHQNGKGSLVASEQRSKNGGKRGRRASSKKHRRPREARK